MTDATPPSAAPNRTFDGKNIWLPQFAVQSLKAGILVMDGYTFRDCNIEGPAVLAVVSNVAFESCDMGAAHDVADLFLSPRGKKITGTVAFTNSRFINCRFVMVGFTGDEAFLSAAIPSITLTTDA